jgi:hypothetical protein
VGASPVVVVLGELPPLPPLEDGAGAGAAAGVLQLVG